MDLLSNESLPHFVSSVFQTRKKNFSHSLKKILLQISKDQLIQKLALDEASSYFISNRIEEIANTIFTDDREKYIESLLQIIEKLEKNQKKVNYSLNYEIESKLANSILMAKQKSRISQIESEMFKKMGGILINQDSNEIKPFDPAQPETYHIFAAVDITSFSLKMKFIQTDLKTIKETTTILFDKAKSYMNQIRTKACDATKNYYQIKKKLEMENSQLSEKLKEINDSFESTTLPMLNQQVSDIKKKYHEKNAQRKSYIIQIQGELEELQTQRSNLLDENQKLKELLTTLTAKNSENEKLIENLQNQTQQDKQNIIDKSSLIENLQNELALLKNNHQQLADSHENLKKDFERISAELTLSEENNKYMTIELNQLKDQLPKEKEANFAAITQISDLKDENQSLKKELDAKSVIIATFSKQNNDLSTKLSAIDHSFTIYKEKNETNQNIFIQNQNKIEKQNQKINEFQKLLSESSLKLEKYKNRIKMQKEEIQNMMLKISDYEKQLSLKNNDMKINKDTIVGMEVAIYKLKSKIALLKEEKSNLQKQVNSSESNSSKSIVLHQISINDENISKNGIEITKEENKNQSNLLQINADLRMQINQLLKKNLDLEGLLKKTQNNESMARKIEKLQNLNEQQSLIINTIQNISPDLDLNSYPQMLTRLIKAKEFSTIVLKTLTENDYETAILKITEIKTDSVTMNRIRCIFKDMNDQDIVETLKSFRQLGTHSNLSYSKKSNSSSKSIKYSSEVDHISSLIGSSISSIGKKVISNT